MTLAKYEPPQAINLAQQFPPDRFTVLSSTQEVCAISPFVKPRLSVVKIDPNPAAGYVYESAFCAKDKQYPENSEVALGKNAINSLADAEGIIWDSSQRIDDRKEPNYVEWQVWGHRTLPDGSRQPVFGTKAVDTRPGGPVEAELRKMVANKTRSWEGQPPKMTQREADEWVEKELLAARGNMLSMAETKARLRAVRAGLKLKSKYTRKELSKPFVVIAYDFAPDYSDPEIRRMAMSHALQAQYSLYGGQQPALPPPQAHIVDAEHTVVQTSAPPLQGPDEHEDWEGEQEDLPLFGDPATGELDPLQDMLYAIANADADELKKLGTAMSAHHKADKYTKKQWDRLKAAYTARGQALGMGGAR